MKIRNVVLATLMALGALASGEASATSIFTKTFELDHGLGTYNVNLFDPAWGTVVGGISNVMTYSFNYTGTVTNPYANDITASYAVQSTFLLVYEGVGAGSGAQGFVIAPLHPGVNDISGIASGGVRAYFGGVTLPYNFDILFSSISNYTSFAYDNPLGFASSIPITFTHDTPKATITFTLYYEPSGVAIPSGVPEPATWAMLLTGFAGIGAAMRRKARQPVAVSYS